MLSNFLLLLIILILSVARVESLIEVDEYSCQDFNLQLEITEMFDMVNYATYLTNGARDGRDTILNEREMRLAYNTFLAVFGSDTPSEMRDSASSLLSRIFLFQRFYLANNLL